MPRAVRDSDDETELRGSVRTRVRAASTTSNTDSPRRSARNMKSSAGTGSSPESIDEANQNTTGRATRSKTANLDKSLPAGSGRTLRSRMNSASSDVSENWAEPDLENLPKRLTRKAVTSVAVASPKSLRLRGIRAVSEAKSTPPAVRSRRVTRASSVDPGMSETETQTPVKRRTRASMVPLQPTVTEEHEAKTKAYRSLENTVVEIDEDDDLVIPCSQTKRRSKVLQKREQKESEESKNVKELNIESENSTSDSSKNDEESMNDKSIKVAEKSSIELIDESSLESCALSNNSTLKEKESTNSQSTDQNKVFNSVDDSQTNNQIKLINIEDQIQKKLEKYVEVTVEQLSNCSNESVIDVCDHDKKENDPLLDMKKLSVKLNRDTVDQILAEKVKKETLSSNVSQNNAKITIGMTNDILKNKHYGSNNEVEGTALSCSPNKSKRNTSESPLKLQVEKEAQIPDSDAEIEDEDHLFQDINEEEWIVQKEKSIQRNNEDQSSSKDSCFEYREDEENKSPNKHSSSRLENSTSKTESAFENINSSNLKDSLNKSTRKSISENSVQQISLMEVDEDSQNEDDISVESQKKDYIRKSMNRSKKHDDSETEKMSSKIVGKSPKAKNQLKKEDELFMPVNPDKSFNISPNKNFNNRKSSQMNTSAALASPEKNLEKSLSKSPKNKKDTSSNELLTQDTAIHSELTSVSMVSNDINDEEYSEEERVAQFNQSSSPDEHMKKSKKNRKSQIEESVVLANPESSPNKSLRKSPKNRKSCQLEESVVQDSSESSPNKSLKESPNKSSPMKELDVEASSEQISDKSLRKSLKNRKSCQFEESVVQASPGSSPNKSLRESTNNKKSSPMKELDIEASSEQTSDKSLRKSLKNRKSCQFEETVVQACPENSPNKSLRKSPNNRKSSSMKELVVKASPEKTSNKSLRKSLESNEDSEIEVVSENEMQLSSQHKNDLKLEKKSNLDKSNRKSITKTPVKSNEDHASVESRSRKSLNKSGNKSLNTSVMSVKSTAKSMLEEPPEKDDSDLTDQDKRLAENIEHMKTENPPKLDFSTLAQCDSSSDEENDTESQYIFRASSVSSNNGKSESETENEKFSIDSDIANELNLAGKDIDHYEDDDEPGDECDASDNESSDVEDDGEDLEDFIVPDDEVEESADSEEDDSEVNDIEQESEEADDDDDNEPQERENVLVSKDDHKNKSNNKSRNVLSDESSGSESDDEGTETIKIKSLNNSRKSIIDKSLNISMKKQNISNIEQTKNEIKGMNKSLQNKSLNVSKTVKDKISNVSLKENQNKSKSKPQDSLIDVDTSESGSEQPIDTKSVEHMKNKSLNKSKLSIKDKSLNTSKSIKDKSMNNSFASEQKDENLKKSLKNKSSNDSKSVFDKSLMNESKSDKNKRIDSSSLNSSGNTSQETDAESKICNEKDKSNERSVNVSVKDKSGNISKKKKHEKSLESLSGSDIEEHNIDSSPESESEEGEDSYHIVDGDDMDPLKSKNKKLLIECSTPKPGVTKKTERFSNASDSFYEDKSSIAKGKRKSGSLNDLSGTKGVTKVSMDNASKSILDTDETPDALKSRQKWKLIPLNQSALPSGVDTPVTKFLKKAKLNDSLPALPLQDTRDEAESKKSQKKKSKNNKSVQDESFNGCNEHKNMKKKSLVDVSKVSEDSIIAIDEKSKGVEEERSDLKVAAEGEKKKNKKNKNKKNRENDLEAVEPISKQSQLVENVSESKEKKKKNKNKEIRNIEEKVDDTIKIEEKSKKKKRKLTDVEDPSKQVKKQKSKHEDTTSELDETLKLALRTLEKLNSKGLKKPKKVKSPVMSDSDNEAPESLDIKKARESAMASMKLAAESVKSLKEARRKKHEEIIERKSVKRLPDDLLNELDEQPVQHREKRRKINKNDEYSIVPSKSMFGPGKMTPQNLKVEDADVTPSSAGGTTEFGVVDLEKAKKITKKSSAFSFRDKMLSRNQRMPMKSYLSQQLKSKSKSSL